MQTLGLGVIETPICEASLVADPDGNFYLAHPQSESGRTNLTIHRSRDSGLTWSATDAVVVSNSGPGAGYSSLQLMVGGQLGVVYNAWPTDEPGSSEDGPGEFIVFTSIPLNLFPGE